MMMALDVTGAGHFPVLVFALPLDNTHSVSPLPQSPNSLPDRPAA